MDHDLVWLNETLSHIRNKRVLFEPNLGLSLWDSLSDHSEALLWRSMVFGTVVYFVRTKCIKQVRETFLQGILFFSSKDPHVYKVSMALRPGEGVFSALMSQEHLICIFNIFYFWSVNPFKKWLNRWIMYVW